MANEKKWAVRRQRVEKLAEIANNRKAANYIVPTLQQVADRVPLYPDERMKMAMDFIVSTLSEMVKERADADTKAFEEAKDGGED